MKRKTMIYLLVSIILIVLLAYIISDVPENDLVELVPTDYKVVPTPTPIATLIPIIRSSGEHYTPSVENTTDDKSDWDKCDPRHNATHLYVQGCWGTGGSGGDNSGGNTGPENPIPEQMTITLLVCGLLLLIVYVKTT